MAKQLTEMSLRAYAETKGVNESAIRKARASGRLGPQCFGEKQRGKKLAPFVYKELADLDWVNNFNPKYDREIKGTKGTGPTTTSAQIGNTKAAPGSKSFNETKATQAQIDLQLSAIRLQKERGELVQKSLVYEHLFEFGKEIRIAFQDLPDQLIDNILAASSREEAYDIMAAGIDGVLHRLTTVETALRV